jgi:hypothetical protein
MVTPVEHPLRHHFPGLLKEIKKRGLHGLSLYQMGIDGKGFAIHLPCEWPRCFILPKVKTFGDRIPVWEQDLDTGEWSWQQRYRHVQVVALNMNGNQIAMDTRDSPLKFYPANGIMGLASVEAQAEGVVVLVGGLFTCGSQAAVKLLRVGS